MTTITLRLSESTLANAQKVARDMGFNGVGPLIRWSLDDTLQRQGIYEEARKRHDPRKPALWHRTHRDGSIRSRIEALPVGAQFTAEDIRKRGEDLQSVGVTLHYLHRTGLIGLRRNAKRIPGKGYTPAVFVRKESVA